MGPAQSGQCGLMLINAKQTSNAKVRAVRRNMKAGRGSPWCTEEVRVLPCIPIPPCVVPLLPSFQDLGAAVECQQEVERHASSAELLCPLPQDCVCNP